MWHVSGCPYCPIYVSGWGVCVFRCPLRAARRTKARRGWPATCSKNALTSWFLPENIYGLKTSTVREFSSSSCCFTMSDGCLTLPPRPYQCGYNALVSSLLEQGGGKMVSELRRPRRSASRDLIGLPPLWARGTAGEEASALASPAPSSCCPCPAARLKNRMDTANHHAFSQVHSCGGCRGRRGRGL